MLLVAFSYPLGRSGKLIFPLKFGEKVHPGKNNHLNESLSLAGLGPRGEAETWAGRCPGGPPGPPGPPGQGVAIRNWSVDNAYVSNQI